MINPSIVQAFLSRKLDNHDWLKTASKEDLRQSFPEELTHNPGFRELWGHQLVCLLLVDQFRRFMLHLDMGGGKTRITLFSILARKLRGEKPKAIIFVPYVSSVDTWIEECKTSTPSLKLVPLLGTTKENLRTIEEGNGDVFVICYASAVAALSTDAPSRSGKRKRWNIDPKYVRKVFAGFDTIVADEIHKCSATDALTFRLCRAIATKTTHAIGLSGTPFGKNVEDLWGQFFLIDFGETLGPTKGLFQEAFFIKKQNFFSGFPEYVFDKKKMPVLKRFIKHNSMHYAAEEMNDLPAKRYIKKHLHLPTAFEGYVTKAAAEFVQAVQACANVGGKSESRVQVDRSYTALRQLASGYLTVVGENNDKIKVSFDNNPKLDLLEEYIDAMPYGCKMVVFHHFVHTNQLISERLTKLKIKHARIWSGQKNVLGELKKFREDNNVRALVLNDQSGSSSLNLQHANYMFFFEQPDSAINRQQGEARIWRPGQTKPVYYIDPFMAKTVDERIYYANRQGKNLLDELLKGKAS